MSGPFRVIVDGQRAVPLERDGDGVFHRVLPRAALLRHMGVTVADGVDADADAYADVVLQCVCARGTLYAEMGRLSVRRASLLFDPFRCFRRSVEVEDVRTVLLVVHAHGRWGATRPRRARGAESAGVAELVRLMLTREVNADLAIAHIKRVAEAQRSELQALAHAEELVRELERVWARAQMRSVEERVRGGGCGGDADEGEEYLPEAITAFEVGKAGGLLDWAEDALLDGGQADGGVGLSPSDRERRRALHHRLDRIRARVNDTIVQSVAADFERYVAYHLEHVRSLATARAQGDDEAVADERQLRRLVRYVCAQLDQFWRRITSTYPSLSAAQHDEWVNSGGAALLQTFVESLGSAWDQQGLARSADRMGTGTELDVSGDHAQFSPSLFDSPLGALLSELAPFCTRRAEPTVDVSDVCVTMVCVEEPAGGDV